jgi:hypothetical protein
MWPYNMNESEWLARLEEADGDYPEISPEMIQYYIARGHELRAEQLAIICREAGARLRRIVEGLRALRPAASENWRGHSPAA